MAVRHATVSGLDTSCCSMWVYREIRSLWENEIYLFFLTISTLVFKLHMLVQVFTTISREGMVYSKLMNLPIMG